MAPQTQPCDRGQVRQTLCSGRSAAGADTDSRSASPGFPWGAWHDAALSSLCTGSVVAVFSPGGTAPVKLQ